MEFSSIDWKTKENLLKIGSVVDRAKLGSNGVGCWKCCARVRYELPNHTRILTTFESLVPFLAKNGLDRFNKKGQLYVPISQGLKYEVHPNGLRCKNFLKALMDSPQLRKNPWLGGHVSYLLTSKGKAQKFRRPFGLGFIGGHTKT